ncbi:2-iminobutanoate/2-iminopropanoate deaminase [Cyclonatronum proteinivorum]|uniref:2-iminobutanoate/2-iminopropanoate deaminase n=1 Tax=Cyclonatronum proteinivorum TaxID=1457365 RepID=A0A345UI62_9BACT|nr:RidA family protein [Cyclonatronum proteinivorum]AXJ00164.1 2-iminobutanoate/2-iminopropanoate deaminase [Cyclonatronum proteinivorum]
MSHTIVNTPHAPAALGPYSQATIHNGVLYLSGQIGLVPETGMFAGEDTPAQARQVMKNLKAVLEAGGSSFDKVLRCTIFLSDMADFAEVNAIYGEYFGENPPARETVAVKTLPKHARIEISALAYV